ncbi:NAD(P)-binding domain-containing protein [Rhizobium sp. SAFR-030]|uniref:NAD(P)-binding domain-containing protein n=1 Tax=Rhizobium sp. SAFR-030 TaxID=3387277 RepID=UPI003F7FCCC5
MEKLLKPLSFQHLEGVSCCGAHTNCCFGSWHVVKVVNSRGPETISTNVLTSGGQAATAEAAVKDADAIILSIPPNRMPDAVPCSLTFQRYADRRDICRWLQPVLPTGS